VPVEVLAGPVIARSRAGIGVPAGDLDIAQVNPGTDIGASSNNAARAPDSRPGASTQTAVSGSVPAAIKARSGASNAAHANFEDGPTEPISTATTRMPMHTHRTPYQPRSAIR
jgi:hypothetical protein